MLANRLPRLSLAVLALVAAASACATQPAAEAPRAESASRSGAENAPGSGAGTIDLVVAATTDVHGWLRGWDYYADAADTTRGLTRTATIVDSLRAAHPGRVVLVDAGDDLQGNPLAYVAARQSRDSTSPIVAAMNAAGYDAGAIGNHEYNYGIAHLERAARQARFAFLSANTFRADGSLAFRAWTIVERAGLKVGIVGATTPGVMVWDRDNVVGRLVLRDIVPEVRKAVAAVRGAGADVVIVTVHSGLDEPSSYDTVSTGVPSENVSARLAREIDGIDLVVYGHSHKESAGRTIGRTLMLQARNWAASVGVAHLRVTRGSDGRATVDAAASTSSIVRSIGHAEHAGVLAATQRAHDETRRYVTTPVGTTPVAWRADSSRVADTPIIDLINEIERKATGAQLASSAAFSTEAVLGPGDITAAQLARLYPYDNTLRAIRISGKQLREYLEYSARFYRTFPADSLIDPSVPGYNFDIVSGADYTIDLSRPQGSRITRLLYQGRPIVDADTFTMALNNYRQTGGGGYAMLRGAPVIYESQQEIRQFIIDEVKRRGTIRPADFFTKNWEIVPAAAVAQAYGAMQRGAGARDRSAAVTAAAIPVTKDAPSTARDAGQGRFLRIIAFNDLHGAMEARPDSRGVNRGGVQHMAGVIQRLRAECAPRCVSIVLAGGDLFQGTAPSNLAFGRPMVDALHALDLSASALGNHEFDWGPDTLRARMRDARFGILAANVRDARTGADVPWIRDDTLIVRDGVRIGIVGIATVETATDAKAAFVEPFRFADPAPVIVERARALRARGADVVVVIAHEGGFCDEGKPCRGTIFEIARQTQEVDAIVAGHTHSRVATRVGRVPVVMAWSSGRAVGVIDLPLAAGVWTDTMPRVFDVTDSTPALPAVDAIARRAVDVVAARMREPVATTAAALSRDGRDAPMRNLIADAQRAEAKADVALMNSGGVRTGLPAGPVNFGHVFEVQPFGNLLTIYRVRGADLRTYLESYAQGNGLEDALSGATIAVDTTQRGAARVTAIRIGGRPLDPARVYTIAINDYMAGLPAARAMGARALEVRSTTTTDLDALVRYLRAQPQPVRGPADARWLVSPAGAAR